MGGMRRLIMATSIKAYKQWLASGKPRYYYMDTDNVRYFYIYGVKQPIKQG